MTSKFIPSLAFAALCFAQMSFAAQTRTLDGQAAQTLWNQLPAASEKQDDGWRWRENAAWSCKKFFDSETRQDRFECYRK